MSRNVNYAICEYPINDLFNTINTLQLYDELDQVTDLMRMTLKDYWDKIPEKRGRAMKEYKGLIFYSNGLCHSKKNKFNSIILPSWESKTTLKQSQNQNQNQIKPEFKLIKNVSLLWYYQVMEYLKRKYKVGINSVGFDGLFSGIQFLEHFNALSDDEKLIARDMLRIERNNAIEQIHLFISFLFENIVSINKEMPQDRLACVMLTDPEIEYVIELCKINAKIEHNRKPRYFKDCELVEKLIEFKNKINQSNDLFYDVNLSIDCSCYYRLYDYESATLIKFRESIKVIMEKFNAVEEPTMVKFLNRHKLRTI